MTVAAANTTVDRIQELLGDEAESLLSHVCGGVPKEKITVPGPEHVDRVFKDSDRNPRVLVNLQRLYDHGRLGGTGYLSILPVDQGIEHSGASAFGPNVDLFDPENIVRLAVEGGCNGVASTVGVLGSLSRRWAHKIPFIVKLNHNELMTYPNSYEQVLFASVEQAWELGASAVGATVYFGGEDGRRELVEIAEAFAHAHELGLATILWCYLRNEAFKVEGRDYHAAADLTGQANHLGVTIQADVIKQKMATNNGGYPAVGFGKTSDRVYGDLVTDHPIDLVRWQVVNCYMGKIPLINSGGASKGAGDLEAAGGPAAANNTPGAAARGAGDLEAAVRTAVINKRAGGAGLISGRKAFQKPTDEGIALLNAIQDVYLAEEITVA